MVCPITYSDHNKKLKRRHGDWMLTRYLYSLSKQQKSSNKKVLFVNDATTSVGKSSLARVLKARQTWHNKHVSVELAIRNSLQIHAQPDSFVTKENRQDEFIRIHTHQWCTSIKATTYTALPNFNGFHIYINLPSVLWSCWLGIRKSIQPVKILSDGVLTWLSICSEVQMICIWSSWCYCQPIISCFIKITTGLTFLVPA